MKYNIHGKKIKVTPAIKTYLEEKIGKLDKYLSNPNEINSNIVIRISGLDQIVEVTINAGKLVLRSEERDTDLYKAIDKVQEKLERMIRKNKTKLKKKNKLDFVLDFKTEKENDNKIVRRKVVENKPMDENEAILQMEMLDHDFYVFNNSKTNNIEILYKRKDNNYGIIEIK